MTRGVMWREQIAEDLPSHLVKPLTEAPLGSLYSAGTYRYAARYQLLRVVLTRTVVQYRSVPVSPSGTDGGGRVCQGRAARGAVCGGYACAQPGQLSSCVCAALYRNTRSTVLRMRVPSYLLSVLACGGYAAGNARDVFLLARVAQA